MQKLTSLRRQKALESGGRASSTNDFVQWNHACSENCPYQGQNCLLDQQLEVILLCYTRSAVKFYL